jgi:hypothetical protein
MRHGYAHEAVLDLAHDADADADADARARHHVGPPDI